MAGAGSRRDAAEENLLSCRDKSEDAVTTLPLLEKEKKSSPDPPRMTCTSRDADGGAGKSRPSKEREKKKKKASKLWDCCDANVKG